MFDFLTIGIGYSPAAAQRRIDGARLLRQLPEIAPKIEQGHINLSQISLLQKTIRNYQRDTSHKINLKQKKVLLDKISNCNSKESELILAQELNLPLPCTPETKQIHKDESQSLTIHFSKDEMGTLDQIKNLKSNAIGSLDYKSLFLFLAKQELKKYQRMHTSNKKELNLDIKSSSETIFASAIQECSNTANITSDKEVDNRKITTKEASKGTGTGTGTGTELAPSSATNIEKKQKLEINFSNNLYKKIPRGVYKTILKPGACCEYKDPVTNKICGSKVFLQIDHIKPRWAYHHEKDKSSAHQKENLRVLCGNHNKLVYHLQKSLKLNSK